MDPVAADGAPRVAPRAGIRDPPVGKHLPVPHLLAVPHPGPLQTAAYIRALLKAVRDRRPNLIDDVEDAVQVRVARQHVTYEGDHEFAIVLEENVLRHQIGGPAVLREQLEYLRTSMSLPSMTLGVIPFGADRSLLRPVEMFFLFDDKLADVELVSGVEGHAAERGRDVRRCFPAAVGDGGIRGHGAGADRPGYRRNRALPCKSCTFGP